MKIYVLFEFGPESTGGGANFLKLLSQEFKKLGVLAESEEAADVVLFNSHHFISKAFKLKLKYPLKYFVHRIDGPMSVYTNRKDDRDRIVAMANKAFADGIVFQSAWSQQQNHLYSISSAQETVIHNAVASVHEINKNTNKPIAGQKVRILTSCWSLNANKGHDVYQWIDENIDFDQYEVNFIGRSPYQFKNIKMLGVKGQSEILHILKEHHLYIFPSRFEACSNALLEAMTAGVPTLAYRGSSNIELVKNDALLFSDVTEIPAKLEAVVKNYVQIQESIKPPSLEGIARSYVAFCQRVLDAGQAKQLNFLDNLKFRIRGLLLRI